MTENKPQFNQAATPSDAPIKGVCGVGRTLMQRLRSYFLAGILFTAPISITIYLTYLFLTFVDSIVSQILPQEWYEALYGGMTVPGIGLVIALVFFVVIGWMATNVLGRLVMRLSEYIVNRMPVVRTLYGVMKQVFETVMASQSSAFREVVMIEYPRKGIWALGLVAGVTEGEIKRSDTEDMVNVFLPTAFNPTAGLLIFVARSELTYLNMTVEQALKLIVSGGIMMPVDPAELERRQEEDLKKKTQKIAGSVKKAISSREAKKPKE